MSKTPAISDKLSKRKPSVDFRPERPSFDAPQPVSKRGIDMRGSVLTPDGRTIADAPTIDLDEFVGGPVPIPADSKLSRKSPQDPQEQGGVSTRVDRPSEKVAYPKSDKLYHHMDFRLDTQEYPKPVKIDHSVSETKTPFVFNNLYTERTESENFQPTRIDDGDPISMRHVPANPGGEDHSEFRLSLFQDDDEFHESLAKIASFSDLPPLRSLETAEIRPKHLLPQTSTASELPNIHNIEIKNKETDTKSNPNYFSAKFDDLLDPIPLSLPQRDDEFEFTTGKTEPTFDMPIIASPIKPKRRRVLAFRSNRLRAFVRKSPNNTLLNEMNQILLKQEVAEYTPAEPTWTEPCAVEHSATEQPQTILLPTIPRGEPGETILVAEALTKSYYKGKLKIPVLKGVDFSVREKEFVAIVGQSGSGKSTLLHLLGTLDDPESGTIHFDGLRIDNLSTRRRDRLRNNNIGLIFQFYHLLPELTTLENVLSPLMIRETVLGYWARRRSHIAAAKELLEKVGLSHRLNHKPSELSGGEMQRAAIARALVSDPRILLADEPTGNLDARSAKEIIELLRKLNNEHDLTIVMVTHDTNVAKSADRTVRMIDGVVEG